MPVVLTFDNLFIVKLNSLINKQKIPLNSFLWIIRNSLSALTPVVTIVIYSP